MTASKGSTSGRISGSDLDWLTADRPGVSPLLLQRKMMESTSTFINTANVIPHPINASPTILMTRPSALAVTAA
jgi:hypothetical protein